MSFCLVISLMFCQAVGFSQGLFEYFKLTAADDGPEKFDRIIVDFNWDWWLDGFVGCVA